MSVNQVGSIVVAIAILLSSGCRKQSTSVERDPNDIIETEPPNLVRKTLQITPTIGGYYAALPVHYGETTLRYPAILFFHGLGQVGNGGSELDYMLIDGIGNWLAEKRLPGSFSVDGSYHSFLVFMPQYSSRPTTEEVREFVRYMSETYRIDPSRIYLSGLSLGARIITEVASERPDEFAAIVPLAGTETRGDFRARAKNVAEARLPIWAFHNEDDPMAPISEVLRFIDAVNSNQPEIPARLTILPLYGHDAWSPALDPEYKQDGLNIYQWMLKHRR
jgi:predicted esterase